MATKKNKFVDKLKSEVVISEAYFTSLFWNNPDLYNFYPSDKISVDTFLNKDWGFYFGLGRYMHEKGVKAFDDISVSRYVEELKLHKKFEDYGGYEKPEEVMSEVKGMEVNIDAYYDDIKKYALVKSLLSLFGEKVITSDGKYDYRQMNKDQLFIYWNDKVNQLGMDGDNKFDEHDLLKGLKDAIVEWNLNPATGLPFYKSPQMTKICTGWDFGNLYIMGGFGGSGKAQPLNANIMTPNGYVKMGDIKLGDEIFGEDGKIHNVLGIFPQGKKDMYEIVFSDGSKTITCDEHLWNVQNPTQREKGLGFETVTLKDIMNDDLYKIYGKKKYKTWMKYIPMTKPLEFNNHKKLEINPYMLGLLLGDGGLSGGSVMITINKNEHDLLSFVEKYCTDNGLSVNVSHVGSGSIDYRLSKSENNNNPHIKNWLRESLESMGLYPSHSEDKFIPKDYLYSSVSDRIDLLSGLIDTDGEVKGSSYTYSTVSEQLSEDIKFLVQSLGGTAKISDRQTYYTYNGEKKKGKPSYRIHIKMPREIKPFKSNKHKNNFKDGQTDARRTIREINYVGKIEAQCIKTSNPTQLYLTDEMIVTHNTSMSFNKVIMSCIENQEKLLVIANEQSVEEFKKMLVITAMGVGTKDSISRQRINEGDFTEEEMEKMNKAIDWVYEICGGEDNDGIIKFVFMEDYIMDDVKKVIRHYANRGYKSVMVDTGKPSDGGGGKARWEQFTDDFKELYKLCRPNGGGLNLRMWINVQLADSALTRRFLNEHAFGESKKIKNEASVVFMIRAVWADEYSEGNNELQCYKWEYAPKNQFANSRGYYKKEFTLEKGKTYYLVFTPKNRRGQDNKTGLDVLIVEPNFNSNTWVEVGFCSVYDDRNY